MDNNILPPNTTIGFPSNPISATEALDALLNYAVHMRASDIHYDPHREYVVVRLRIDGQIEYAGQLPLRIHEEMIARMKILAGARTDLHSIPQDGRWRAELDSGTFNIRVSFMPTYHGENAVLRLLSTRVTDTQSFAQLGFAPDHVRIIDTALKRTSGLILVTGPTGSGKTTTLHTCLALKSKGPLSIITLEDPIEYELPSVRQIHIRQNNGVSFASGLRSALRQDPDVIMLGEIRDAETARVAIHTALTGHLVLSTLHTNSALEAIPRLLDMGIDRYLLASTLRCVIAQRLVRTMCRECISDGCFRCRYAGYSGRSVIAEIIDIDQDVRNILLHEQHLSSHVSLLRKKGYRPIAEDGFEKIEWGITTQEEVSRVLYEY